MRRSNGLYIAFLLCQLVLEMLLTGLLPFVFEDRPAVWVFCLIFILGGI